MKLSFLLALKGLSSYMAVSLIGTIGSAVSEAQSIDSSSPESKLPTTEIESPLIKYKPRVISSTPETFENTRSFELFRMRLVV
jgi:hypothetical protein